MRRTDTGPITIDERPHDDETLHAWIVDNLDLNLARTPLIPGHAAPFDYIRWSFFASSEAPPTRHDDAPDAVVWANRGGGKTLLGAVATTLDLLFLPEVEVRVLGGSLEQASRMHAHLRRFFARPRLADMIAGRVTDKRLRLSNGSTVELLAQSQTSVRGARVQKLRCDEVELFHPDVWDAAQLTTKSRMCGDRWVRGSIECLSTLHIPHGVMHRLVAEAREGRRRLFKWGVLDVLARCEPHRACSPPDAAPCPLLDECAGRAKLRPGNDAPEAPELGHVPVDDAVRMKSRVSLPVWQSEMLCLRPRRDDSVLPEFDAAAHVVREIPGIDRPDELHWVAGMDFGFRSPGVILWAVVDDDNRVYIVDESVRTGLTITQHAALITDAAWPQPRWIGVDPAGNSMNDQTGKSAASVLKETGFVVRSRRAFVARGLELLRRRLRPAHGEPGIFIHERCVKLIESLERYHYPEHDPEATTPVKDGFDHAVDALRYLIQNLDHPAATRVTRYA